MFPLSSNAAIFGSIDYEDETTGRAAKDFLDSHLLDTIPTVKQKFEDLLAAQGKDEEETPATVTTAQQESPATHEPTFEETEQKNLQQAAAIINAGTAGQTLAQVASAVPDIDLGLDDGDLNDL